MIDRCPRRLYAELDADGSVAGGMRICRLWKKGMEPDSSGGGGVLNQTASIVNLFEFYDAEISRVEAHLTERAASGDR